MEDVSQIDNESQELLWKPNKNKEMKNSTFSGMMKGSNTSKYSEQSKLGTWEQSFKLSINTATGCVSPPPQGFSFCH